MNPPVVDWQRRPSKIARGFSGHVAYGVSEVVSLLPSSPLVERLSPPRDVAISLHLYRVGRDQGFAGIGHPLSPQKSEPFGTWPESLFSIPTPRRVEVDRRAARCASTRWRRERGARHRCEVASALWRQLKLAASLVSRAAVLPLGPPPMTSASQTCVIQTQSIASPVCSRGRGWVPRKKPCALGLWGTGKTATRLGRADMRGACTSPGIG
jgi:hypothetical protein